MILEACVGNLKDALSAKNKGAHQIELCSRLDLDGNSPSIELIKQVTSSLDIPVKIIINPKPYDYRYTEKEILEIDAYIQAIRPYDIDGIVFGPVDDKGMPDLEAISYISGRTDVPITFHKAIDAATDIVEAARALVTQNKVHYILTSGGAQTADEGGSVLLKIKKLIRESASSIQIIGAGKITNENLPSLHARLNLNYYHGKLIVGKL